MRHEIFYVRFSHNSIAIMGSVTRLRPCHDRQNVTILTRPGNVCGRGGLASFYNNCISVRVTLIFVFEHETIQKNPSGN